MRDQVHFLPVLSGPLVTPLSGDDGGCSAARNRADRAGMPPRGGRMNSCEIH
ncbi:hypothetical protein HMPREF3150_05617 [Pseudomonas aeruginosa]|nr:hypothetical protein HMPREF3150_05617 [Pseudomonas aeruginosa]